MAVPAPTTATPSGPTPAGGAAETPARRHLRAVDSRWSTLRSRHARMIGGLSEGGYGTPPTLTLQPRSSTRSELGQLLPRRRVRRRTAVDARAQQPDCLRAVPPRTLRRLPLRGLVYQGDHDDVPAPAMFRFAALMRREARRPFHAAIYDNAAQLAPLAPSRTSRRCSATRTGARPPAGGRCCCEADSAVGLLWRWRPRSRSTPFLISTRALASAPESHTTPPPTRGAARPDRVFRGFGQPGLALGLSGWSTARAGAQPRSSPRWYRRSWPADSPSLQPAARQLALSRRVAPRAGRGGQCGGGAGGTRAARALGWPGGGPATARALVARTRRGPAGRLAVAGPQRGAAKPRRWTSPPASSSRSRRRRDQGS